MRPVSRTIIAAAALSLLAGGVVAQSALTRVPAEVQAGAYALDSAHGKITWSVDHMGFSTYKGQFVNVDADLTLDPANPSAATLTATIPLTEVDSNSDGLDAHLQTADFFDTANHPVATYVSRSVTVDPTAPNRATVQGDLTLRGVTRPVTMTVRFNQAGPSMGGVYRAGFDGEATVRRSDFGITYGLPGLGDEVSLHIEGEFTRP
ncbi:MAG: YceI family protein [Alphaproteobacteria bacterium]|jgi:polyisoprenoid-binding protein YceI|nr:YceI family protein [Alphaproteobacteria bacterium]MBU2041698.1 YceI family protein [Alphaproteobacteria bacterium]MBU2125299.1 YceI family protein [Alphaproteobacteria bacterium]MBU2208730.1 YceI family protein [Alphaproteobacteria bacterium]MBU2290282.1 YceI family protein [Alphaproteobacteria bacterium]